MARTTLHFEQVYAEFYSPIRDYLVKLVGDSEAEDVAQEAFLKISRKLDSFKGESKLSTWIYRIATNTAWDRLKSPSHRQRSRELSFDTQEGINILSADALPGRRTSVESNVVREEMGRCVRDFVDKLPIAYRTVLALSELKGMKNREIADVMGISLETVKVRLHRARAMLKKHMESGCELYRDDRNELACDRREGD